MKCRHSCHHLEVLPNTQKVCTHVTAPIYHMKCLYSCHRREVLLFFPLAPCSFPAYFASMAAIMLSNAPSLLACLARIRANTLSWPFFLPSASFLASSHPSSGSRFALIFAISSSESCLGLNFLYCAVACSRNPESIRLYVLHSGGWGLWF